MVVCRKLTYSAQVLKQKHISVHIVSAIVFFAVIILTQNIENSQVWIVNSNLLREDE